MKTILTDLHTHILPAMDDGAPSVDVSVNILKLLKSRGVERVALTPHFYPAKESLDSFVLRRSASYEVLKSACEARQMPKLCIGAEVRYSAELAQMDVRQLTIGKSNFLLLELPDDGAVPLLQTVVESVLCRDIIPIFAHIERCNLFRRDPEQLLKYVQMGALAQIDFAALSNKPDSFALACLNNGLAHVIASDVHKVSDIDKLSISKKCLDFIPWAESFAKAIWEQTPLPAYSFSAVKKGILGYK